MRLGVFFFVAAVFLLVSGCGDTVAEDATAAEKAALAERKLESGNAQRALQLFEAALAAEPAALQAPLWETGKSESLFYLGRTDEALAVAVRFLSSHDPVVRARAFLVKALVDSKSSPASALEDLSGIDLETLDSHRAETAVSLARELLVQVPLSSLAGYRNKGWLEVYALLELEKRSVTEGDLSRAAMYGAEIDRLYPGAHDRWGRPDYSSQEGSSNTWIALLLPLTGEGSEFAEEVAKGAHLAFDRFAEMHSDAPQLIDFDTEGDSDRLLELMESISKNPSCLAVLGPLTSSSTLAVSSLAKPSGLPVLTPSATSGDIDRIGPPVFRLVISTGGQAAAIAEYAVRRSGYTRFGIIYPYTAAASGEVEQFRAVVQSLGGTVVDSEGYQPGDTDFKNQIRSIKAHAPQAVFLPVSAWDAIQIVPQLKFYSLDVPVFGTSGWDDDIIVRHGGDYMNGVIFTAAFGLNSLYPKTAAFVYTYNRTYEKQPTSLAAQGYDAAEILLDVWSKLSNPTRNRMLRKLSSMTPWYGASGRCVLGTTTENTASWPIMTIVDGEIIGVD